MDRLKVYEIIDGERRFQDAEWGSVIDHPHEVGGWLTLMRKFLTDAESAWASHDGDGDALKEIRKVLAIGVACAEQHGIPWRSIDQPRSNR